MFAAEPQPAKRADPESKHLPALAQCQRVRDTSRDGSEADGVKSWQPCGYRQPRHVEPVPEKAGTIHSSVKLLCAIRQQAASSIDESNVRETYGDWLRRHTIATFGPQRRLVP